MFKNALVLFFMAASAMAVAPAGNQALIHQAKVSLTKIESLAKNGKANRNGTLHSSVVNQIIDQRLQLGKIYAAALPELQRNEAELSGWMKSFPDWAKNSARENLSATQAIHGKLQQLDAAIGKKTGVTRSSLTSITSESIETLDRVSAQIN
jgi:hypothetical protein